MENTAVFNPDKYISSLLTRLQKAFGERLVFLGLQGSYLRGEAHEESDIDILTVISDMTPADLSLYRDVISEIGFFEKSCGFICGKDELSRWNPLEICSLVRSTKNIYGDLSTLVPAYTTVDEINFVKLGTGNLYHELCHRYVHGDRERFKAVIPEIFKSLFFIIQNKYFLESGHFINSKKELSEALSGEDKTLMELSAKIQNGESFDLEHTFKTLFEWCQKNM